MTTPSSTAGSGPHTASARIWRVLQGAFVAGIALVAAAVIASFILLPAAYAQGPRHHAQTAPSPGLHGIFAQAAGAPLAYVAVTVPRPTSEAVIVPRGSTIQTVAGLKGKKVAFNKGSNVHYFFVRLLQKHGLAYGDIDVAFLPPSDARAAFEKGSVDAWVIWDPFLAAAEKTLEARILADARGVVNNRAFYFSSLDYVARNQDVLDVVVAELNRLDLWAKDNRDALAAELAPLFGIPKPVIDLSVDRSDYGTGAVTKAILAEQQRIADVFFELKLLPTQINVLEAAGASVA